MVGEMEKTLCGAGSEEVEPEKEKQTDDMNEMIRAENKQTGKGIEMNLCKDCIYFTDRSFFNSLKYRKYAI